jgi:putative chitinase
MSFNFDFTQEKLAKCLSRNKNTAELFEVFSEVLPRYEITTIERVAAFLAQCGHESADFTVLKENLNYSAEGLSKVFPKRFPTVAAAQPYNRNPEKIANKIYSDRMGNGPEASGEGFKFRGRGAIQLTGKENYTKFANSINQSLDEAVAYTETLAGAIESACWFWSTNKLNALADATDIVALTKRINGGTIGLEDRKHHFENNLITLSA